MKSSFYNIFFNIEDKYYIYNTLSTSILAVPQDVISHLKSNSIDNIDEHGLEILKKNGMVVKFDTNEGAIYEHYYNSIQYCSNPEELRLVILPTYNCNLQCSYCFENCNTTKSHLTDDDISEIEADSPIDDISEEQVIDIKQTLDNFVADSKEEDDVQNY